MVFDPNIKPIVTTAFHDEYNKLDSRTKRRVRLNICATCEISKDCFYDWLNKPELVSPNDRYFIAEVVFGKTVKEIFGNKK